MGESSNKPGSIEKYLEQTIIEYLQSQKEVPEYCSYDFNQIDEFEQAAADDRQKNLFIVEELLNDVLHNVDRTILFQEEYKKAYKAHHQYALFDLDDILPGFALDETLIRQLSFRETLLISNADQPTTSSNNEVKLQAVGGLCVRVELVRGISPPKTKTPDEEINKDIAKRIKELKKEWTRRNTTGGDPKPEAAVEKLKKYEEFLQEQTHKMPQKFVVHLSSEFDVDGKNAGSRIISWVDKDFHTLEERRTELSI